MKLKHFTPLIIFTVIFSTSVIASLYTPEAGSYNETYKEGEHSPDKLIIIEEVIDESVVIIIDKDKIELKENDSYVINESNENYKGELKVIKIDDNKVNISMKDIKRSSHYYKLQIPIVGLISLIATLLIISIIKDIIHIRERND